MIVTNKRVLSTEPSNKPTLELSNTHSSSLRILKIIKYRPESKPQAVILTHLAPFHWIIILFSYM